MRGANVRRFCTKNEISEVLADKVLEHVKKLKNTIVLPKHESQTVVPVIKSVKASDADFAALSTVAQETKGRRVMIFQPTRDAMQSGIKNTRRWHLHFPPKGKLIMNDF